MSIDRFKIILNKSTDEFQKLIISEGIELYESLVYFMQVDKIDKIIEIIKNNELKDQDKNVLKNLLALEPFSSPIIEKFLESKFLENSEFIDKIDYVKTISYGVIASLEKHKKDIRRITDKDVKIGKTQEKLNAVLQEIEKNSKDLKNLQDQKDGNKRLAEIKNEIENIQKELQVNSTEELEKKLKEYMEYRNKIYKIQEEIEKSSELFKTLPKDEA